MKKPLAKMWALILSISVLIATVTAIPIVAHAADASVWDGSSIDTAWYDADETEFELTNAAQLAGLIALSNGAVEGIDAQSFEGKTVSLGCDVSFNGAEIDPIDGESAYFTGVFDGNQHTVKSFKVSNGLFAQTGTGAQIKNLTVEDMTANATQAAGVFVGYNMGSTLTMTNCHVKNATVTANSYSGGLIGITYTGNSVLTVNDCSLDNVTVSGTYTGGVTGVLYNGIVNVENWSVDSCGISGTYVGGVVGYDYGVGGSEIKHAVVNADISGTNCIGGIIGVEYRRNTTRSVIEDCIVSGTLTSTSNKCVGIGGIVGSDSSGQRYYPRYCITIRNCVSLADITLNAGFAGGIFGCMADIPVNLNAANEIEYCDFFGTIKSAGSDETHLGGIVGAANGFVRNCGNFGTIEFTGAYTGTFTGGVVGNTAMGPAFTYNSYNAADVTSTVSSTGGLIGYNGNAVDNYIFDNGYSVGKITNNKGKDSELVSTETIMGLQFWGEIRNAYILRENGTFPYEFIQRYENTCQIPFKHENIAHFYGADMDIAESLSQRVYTGTVKDDSKPFSVTDETATDSLLVEALNHQADTADGYLHWVVYPDDDSAESVTDEPAIQGKEAAFAKVSDYRYPMLAHTSTVRYASEDDAEMGSPVIISSAVDNDDDKIYDAAYRTVVVDPRPEGSNTVKSVTVTDGYGREVEVRDNGNGTYSYTMPRTDAIVTVAYENGFEFLDKVTLTKTYLNKDNYTNAGQIFDPQGILAEDITFSITPYSAFNREEGRQSVAIPAFSESSYTISAGDGTDLVDVALPDYTDAGIGDYWYEVTETAGSTAGVTYDTNTYYMHVVVSREGRNHGISQVTLHKTAPGDDGTYTNTVGDKTAGFTNTFGSGTLTVTKEITGNFADRGKTFKITVTLTAPTDKTVSGDIVYGTETETIPGGWTGSKTVELELGKGDSVTFTNLPDGVTYTVKEDDYSSDGYDNPQYVFDNDSETGDTVLTGTEWSDNYASGTISDSTDTVTVTNNKNATIDVGVIVENAPFVIIILLVVCFGIFILRKRRKTIYD